MNKNDSSIIWYLEILDLADYSSASVPELPATSFLGPFPHGSPSYERLLDHRFSIHVHRIHPHLTLTLSECALKGFATQIQGLQVQLSGTLDNLQTPLLAQMGSQDSATIPAERQTRYIPCFAQRTSQVIDSMLARIPEEEQPRSVARYLHSRLFEFSPDLFLGVELERLKVDIWQKEVADVHHSFSHRSFE